MSVQRITRKKKIYPFIDKLVDVMYNDDLNNLMEESIEGHYDKSIFLMYIVLYFGIYMSIDKSIRSANKKQAIKEELTDIIRDPNKRQACLNFFCTYFGKLVFNEKNEKQSIQN